MKKRFDGAILTLSGYYNYGNVMQRFALQKYLKDNGYNFVSYIDTHTGARGVYRHDKGIKFKTPIRALKRFMNYQRPYWYLPQFAEIYPEARRSQNIIDFVNENIAVKKFDENDNYKSYIVGSDQIWRNWWPGDKRFGYYFLDFLQDRKINRIAYAASFGKDEIEGVMSGEDAMYIRPYIEKFDSISVRERSGREIIKKVWNIGDAEVVVDPTLLLDASVYSDLIDKSRVRYEQIQPIFVYIIDENEDTQRFVNQVQEDRKQAISKIRAHAGTENDVMPCVESWLKGFRDTELVITNSFHGMIFSVINNTDFIIIGKESGGLSRIYDFLSEYKLLDRFVDEGQLANFDLSKIAPINWNAVNTKLDQRRDESGKWLLNSVKRSYRI